MHQPKSGNKETILSMAVQSPKFFIFISVILYVIIVYRKYEKEKSSAKIFRVSRAVSQVTSESATQFYTSDSKFPSEDIDERINPSSPVIAIGRHPVWHKKSTGPTWQGLPLPIITAEPNGRLGNVMGEYALLYALGLIYNVTVRLHPQMKEILYGIFPNISMPLIPGEFVSSEWEIIKPVANTNFAKAEAAAAGLLGPHLFLITDYQLEIQLFNTYRQDILREFTFSPDIQQKVHQFWNNALNDGNKDNTQPVLVGIDVRRTEYIMQIERFHSELPGDIYFFRAINYYRGKFSNVAFVVVSDDMEYAKETFAHYPDVIYAPGDPHELDMAVLASCNHSIITVGSLSFWTGYLTGGEVLYPNISASSDYQFNEVWYKVAHLDFFTPIPVN